MKEFKQDLIVIVSMMTGATMIESTGVWFWVACALIVIPAVHKIVESIKTLQQ